MIARLIRWLLATLGIRGISPQGPISEPPHSDPFSCAPNSISFPLQAQVTPRGEEKFYQGSGPDLYQYMNDARLNGSRFKGQLARHYSNWAFLAVRTNDPKDVSTVGMSVSVRTLWNPLNPATGMVMSNSGRNIYFMRGNQQLHVFLDMGNTTGGYGGCGTTDTLIEKSFQIPNDVFEGMTDIKVEARSELFFACP